MVEITMVRPKKNLATTTTVQEKPEAEMDEARPRASVWACSY